MNAPGLNAGHPRAHRNALLALAAALAVTACNSSAPTTPSSVTAPTASLTPAVVIISVDGLRPDAIRDTTAPNIMALSRRGAFTWQAQTIVPSNTLPSHVSMLSGFGPEVHRVVWDDYLPARGRVTVPTVFAASRTAGLRTAMIVGKDKFRHFRDTDAVDVWVLDNPNDSDVAAEAQVKAAFGVDLLFIHLPGVDVEGHARQWMSDAYLASVRRADEAIGRIVSSLSEQTTVILTADHGGRAGGHGTAHPLDTTIPWIVSGPRTFQGRQLATAVRTVDTAATAAYVLGFALSPAAAGRPVLEAFRPN
jgi:predicted AlkP superfamily pyrophosphatase or phosphodiesterase